MADTTLLTGYYLVGKFSDVDTWVATTENAFVDGKLTKDLIAGDQFKIIYYDADLEEINWNKITNYSISENTNIVKGLGNSNVYKVKIPEGGYTKVIFCRMNPATTENNWDNKWSQTSDLDLSSGNYAEITGWENSQNWITEVNAEENTVYLKPNSDWASAGARFAAYFFVGDKNIWVDVTETCGDDNYIIQNSNSYAMNVSDTTATVQLSSEVSDTYNITVTGINCTCEADKSEIDAGGSINVTITNIDSGYQIQKGLSVKNGSEDLPYSIAANIVTIENIHKNLDIVITAKVEDGYYLACNDSNHLWADLSPIYKLSDYKSDKTLGIEEKRITLDLNTIQFEDNIFQFKTVYVKDGNPNWFNCVLKEPTGIFASGNSITMPDYADGNISITSTNTEKGKVTIFVKTNYKTNNGDEVGYHVTQYFNIITDISRCTITPQDTLIYTGDSVTFTITGADNSELTFVSCTVDNINQDISYSTDKVTATIEVTNATNDIIITAIGGVDVKSILMHPFVAGTTELDKTINLYPKTLLKNIELTGAQLKALTVGSSYTIKGTAIQTTDGKIAIEWTLEEITTSE